MDRSQEGFVLKGLQDSARVLTPGNTSKKCPALEGRYIGMIDSSFGGPLSKRASVLPPVQGCAPFSIAPGVETWLKPRLKPQAESLSPFGTKAGTSAHIFEAASHSGGLIEHENDDEDEDDYGEKKNPRFLSEPGVHNSGNVLLSHNL